MNRVQRRLALVALILLSSGTAAALVLTALDDTLAWFHSPSDVADGAAPDDRFIRVGGLVVNGSVDREGERVAFLITDTAHDLLIVYSGILPDLFREGQGVVAGGRFNADGVFVADEILARHDETYMAPEVADALERAGHPVRSGPPPAGRPAVGY